MKIRSSKQLDILKIFIKNKVIEISKFLWYLLICALFLYTILFVISLIIGFILYLSPLWVWIDLNILATSEVDVSLFREMSAIGFIVIILLAFAGMILYTIFTFLKYFIWENWICSNWKKAKKEYFDRLIK